MYTDNIVKVWFLQHVWKSTYPIMDLFVRIWRDWNTELRCCACRSEGRTALSNEGMEMKSQTVPKLLLSGACSSYVEMFSLCGKIVGHFPIYSWLRVATAFIKQQASAVAKRWDGKVSIGWYLRQWPEYVKWIPLEGTCWTHLERNVKHINLA